MHSMSLISSDIYLKSPSPKYYLGKYQGGAICDGYDVPSKRRWCYVSK